MEEEGERKEENRDFHLTLGDFHLTGNVKARSLLGKNKKTLSRITSNHYLCLAAVSTNDFLVNLGNHRNDGIA